MAFLKDRYRNGSPRTPPPGCDTRRLSPRHDYSKNSKPVAKVPNWAEINHAIYHRDERRILDAAHHARERIPNLRTMLAIAAAIMGADAIPSLPGRIAAEPLQL